MPTPELAEAIAWEVRVASRLATAGGPTEARAIVEELWHERSGDHLGADVVVEEIHDGAVSGEWVGASGAGDAVVLYVHGGGFTFGAAALERETLARLGAAASARTLAIDYRLAPEHSHPAAEEDTVSAYRWLLDSGVPAHRIAVVGESAGGALVVMALVAARNLGLPLPGAVVLWSPFADLTVSGASIDDNAASDPFVKREAAEGSAAAYLQGDDARAASPIFADLSGFPPMLVQVGTNEAFLDDGIRLVAAATTAGVEATLDTWDDVLHMWHGFPNLPDAVAATEKAGAFIARHTSTK